MKVPELIEKKQNKQKMSMVTCYDYTSAKIVASTNIDIILVGDSLSMTMHGYENTTHATTEMMTLHTQAVAKAAPQKLILGDMPFLSTRKGLTHTMNTVEKLVQAGSNALKFEGFDDDSASLISHIIHSGVPLMGHLGLTPQFIQQFGGFKVQGKNEKAAKKILDQAQALEDLGCCALVLECIPSELAQSITNTLKIPTIGIGAGPHCDGQVLVWQDLLGMDKTFRPKFVKQYAQLYQPIHQALQDFHHEVTHEIFPKNEHAYH